MERDNLTEDELRVAAQAYGLALLEDKAFVPLAEYLPDCESLRKRGFLARRMEDGKATYQMTSTGVTAMELAGLTNPDNVSVN